MKTATQLTVAQIEALRKARAERADAIAACLRRNAVTRVDALKAEVRTTQQTGDDIGNLEEQYARNEERSGGHYLLQAT